MDISATRGPGQVQMPVSAEGRIGHRGVGRAAGEKGAPVEAVSREAAEPPAIEAPVAGKTGPKGVLGLLQAGHFRGVAAVRLSINFHEQLAALDEAAAGSRVAEAMTGLQGVLDRVSEAIPADAGQDMIERIGSARDAFAAGVEGLIGEFRNADIGQGELFDAMQVEFGILAQSLRAGLAADGAEFAENEAAAPVLTDEGDGDAGPAAAALTGESPASAAPETGDGASTVEAALAGIDQVFADYLGGLQADLGMIAAVPEFVAPDNNGAAFEKFISMYRDLAGIGVEADEAADAVPAEGIDQQV